MPSFLPEPPFSHDQSSKIGVLLVNLGTPTAPTPKAIRPYLRQFLSDPRVVEIPKAVWWLILNAFILPFRPQKTAAKYASVWMSEGSPLKVWTTKQAKLLKGWLGEQGHQEVVVDYAMRYGQPSIAAQMDKLKAAGCEKLLILPLYPQYSASTSATVIDEVGRVLASYRNQPAIRTVRSFHDDEGYIKALAERVREYWQTKGRGDHLLMSFHGVPRYTLDKGDPYHCHCHKTGRLLAEELDLAESEYTVAFQSRFGRAEWLQPYVAATLKSLAKANTGRLDVICPGFVADCLETLEEIAIEGKQDYLQAGGKDYHFIPCLNDSPLWIDALTALTKKELSGWLLTDNTAIDNTQQCTLSRAQALGAQN
jgi:protoporphyrin/coproporphyrin ferrochelatase